VGGLKWPVLVSTVQLGGQQYRVVRPVRTPSFACLYEGRLGAQFCLDNETAMVFAQAWGLAARSPRTIDRPVRPRDLNYHLPVQQPQPCWVRLGGLSSLGIG
jgi:hypothetical protein